MSTYAVPVLKLFIYLCVCSHDESEKRLPKSCLVLLCKYDPVLRWSRDCDNSLYQGLVEILIPDVLRPIPSKVFVHVVMHHILCSESQEYIPKHHVIIIFKVI